MTSTPTVFVVDDNPGVRKSLRALFESAELAVETYASAEEFLAVYDPSRAGCLLLDVRLRHQSGLDLQDELRRRKAMLPIIVLTGHGTVPTSVRALTLPKNLETWRTSSSGVLLPIVVAVIAAPPPRACGCS